MVIAFCTPCMNRGWQLRRTLTENMAVIRSSGHFLTLCNYNSSDGLDDYLAASFRGDCRAGDLVTFSTRQPGRFHASKAKNAAHRLALRRRPDVVFNLD